MRLFLTTTIATLLLFTLTTCKKEKEITVKNVIYVFTVIDEITKEPVDSCIVLLATDIPPELELIDTLGITNEDGKFIYDYDIKTNGGQGSSGVQDFRFLKENYYPSIISRAREKDEYIIFRMIELTPEQ